MCTAISDIGSRHLFGRTLDLEFSYGESTVITPRNFPLSFLKLSPLHTHLAFIGTAHICDGVPLYYDAVNESGLAAAALSFPHDAVYKLSRNAAFELASFELIPRILATCKDLASAVSFLKEANILPTAFRKDLPSTPLHWMIADGSGAVVIEPSKRGLEIFDDPFGVMTNSPTFPYHADNVAIYAHVSPAMQKNTLCPKTPLRNPSRGAGSFGLPGDFSSASRFVRALFSNTHTCRESGALGDVSRFFHVMDTVSQPKGCALSESGAPISTVYTSCADTSSGTYYYTTYGCRRIMAVDMKKYPLDSDQLICFDRGDTEDVLFL